MDLARLEIYLGTVWHKFENRNQYFFKVKVKTKRFLIILCFETWKGIALWIFFSKSVQYYIKYAFSDGGQTQVYQRLKKNVDQNLNLFIVIISIIECHIEWTFGKKW